MAVDSSKSYGSIPLFNPAEGLLVRAPDDDGPGWWAGAPGASFDSETDTFYLVYRLRRPREKGRGIECRIASSSNGISFRDIWALPKATLNAHSVERCALQRGVNGKWQLYLSYSSQEDNRWRIAMLESDEPDQFNVQDLQELFTAEALGCEGVKDPAVFQIGRMTYMLFSYATREESLSEEQRALRHETGDIYNTGLTLSRTGAAMSGDGRRFQWLGDVSPRFNEISSNTSQDNNHPPKGWDSYCKRTGALTPLCGGGYQAFYDGSSSVEGNYEERTGIAVTFDLKNYYSLTPDEPALVSPCGSGSLRYLDVISVGRELFYYYEMSRPDGGHELRVSIVER